MLHQLAEQFYACINSVLHYLGGRGVLCVEATDAWHMLIVIIINEKQVQNTRINTLSERNTISDLQS